MIKELNDIVTQNTHEELTKYQSYLITWINDLGYRNKESFKYDNIHDMSILLYLLIKDIMGPNYNESEITEYFNKKYGYGDLIHKLLVDLVDKNPDYYELISDIKDTYSGNAHMQYDDFSNHIETLYNNEYLSVEESHETLIFGDNILEDDMTVRELSDSVRRLDKEYVNEYIGDLNLGDITFTISDSSIMYLKDTAGVKIATVTVKNGFPVHVIRYTNEDGSALFLLFEPELIKTETIYGISLDSAQNEERGLLILEKNKDDSVYRLLFGRSDW